jgi:hypothetical protein
MAYQFAISKRHSLTFASELVTPRFELDRLAARRLWCGRVRRSVGTTWGVRGVLNGVAALSAELRAEVERHVRSGYLAGLPDGPRSFAIIVRVVRGTLPAGG